MYHCVRRVGVALRVSLCRQNPSAVQLHLDLSARRRRNPRLHLMDGSRFCFNFEVICGMTKILRPSRQPHQHCEKSCHWRQNLASRGYRLAGWTGCVDGDASPRMLRTSSSSGSYLTWIAAGSRLASSFHQRYFLLVGALIVRPAW